MHFHRARSSAFTIVEVFGVLVLISMLVALLLPAVQAAREGARRTSCANNMMNVALGAHAYHSSFEQLPIQLSGTDGSTVAGQDNDRRLSVFVGLLPYINNPELDARIAQSLPRNQQNDYGLDPYAGMSSIDPYSMAGGQPVADKKRPKSWVAGGPEPFELDYAPWSASLPQLRCPSDPYAGVSTNYTICLGDGLLTGDSGPMKEVQGRFVIDPELAEQCEAAMRGVFVPRSITRFSDVTDGISHTIMFGEIATDLGDMCVRTTPAKGPGPDILRDNPSWAWQSDLIDPDRPEFWMDNVLGKKLMSNASARRGHRWADGMPLYTAFNTILPPNREITLHSDRDDCWGVLPAGSRHQGGAHCAFVDGSVRFIGDSIEAGNASAATVYAGSKNVTGSESPFGLWGALGTRAGVELGPNSIATSDAVE